MEKHDKMTRALRRRTPGVGKQSNRVGGRLYNLLYCNGLRATCHVKKSKKRSKKKMKVFKTQNKKNNKITIDP